MTDLGVKTIWVTGHRGMAGSAIVRRLKQDGIDCLTAGRDEVDLRDQAAVSRFMAAKRPEVVVVAAARVGGIYANAMQPADFLWDNLAIAANVIESAHRIGVEKLLFLGSSCIYPRLAPQPMSEDMLLTGPLEPTNEWYAIAKIAGIKLCQAYRAQFGRSFIACQPTNLYGPGDNFDLTSSHVLPALLRKAHDAKVAGAATMEVWGSGRARREFLHVDDLAEACVHLLRHYDDAVPLNIGWGHDLTIAELAELVCATVGFRGEIAYDRSKPDGTPQKLLEVARVEKLGWRPRISLREGLAQYYDWFLQNQSSFRR